MFFEVRAEMYRVRAKMYRVRAKLAIVRAEKHRVRAKLPLVDAEAQIRTRAPQPPHQKKKTHRPTERQVPQSSKSINQKSISQPSHYPNA